MSSSTSNRTPSTGRRSRSASSSGSPSRQSGQPRPRGKLGSEHGPVVGGEAEPVPGLDRVELRFGQPFGDLGGESSKQVAGKVAGEVGHASTGCHPRGQPGTFSVCHAGTPSAVSCRGARRALPPHRCGGTGAQHEVRPGPPGVGVGQDLGDRRVEVALARVGAGPAARVAVGQDAQRLAGDLVEQRPAAVARPAQISRRSPRRSCRRPVRSAPRACSHARRPSRRRSPQARGCTPHRRRRPPS